jgi:hypothetical protein
MLSLTSVFSARQLVIPTSVCLGAGGLRDVEQFEVRRIASRFVREVAKLAPSVRTA